MLLGADIIAEISWYLDEKTLKVLARTNRACATVVAPALWRYLTVSPRKPLPSNLYSIRQHVRFLFLEGDQPNMYLGFLLSTLPNLQELTLELPNMRQLALDFTSASPTLQTLNVYESSASGAHAERKLVQIQPPKRLRSMKFHGHPQFSIQDLAKLLRNSPCLEELIIDYPIAGTVLEEIGANLHTLSVDFETMPAQLKCRNLTTFEFCQFDRVINVELFELLARDCPNLTHFRILPGLHDNIRYAIYAGLGILADRLPLQHVDLIDDCENLEFDVGRVVTALGPCRNTLQTLCIGGVITDKHRRMLPLTKFRL